MNSKALLFGLALSAAGVVLLTVYKQRFEAEASGGEAIDVVVAADRLPLGQVLTKEMVGFRAIPVKYIEERHIRASELDQVIGIRVRTEVPPGASILWSDLATSSEKFRDLSSLVASGMRAITIEADVTSSFGGLLSPGDRVDVLLTAMRESKLEKVTLPLMQNVLVLAVGQDTGGPSVTDRNRRVTRQRNQVTVSVSVAQAQALALASDRGRLTLILRNPDDVAVAEDLPETTAADILTAEEREKKLAKPITVIRTVEKPAKDSTNELPKEIKSRK